MSFGGGSSSSSTSPSVPPGLEGLLSMASNQFASLYGLPSPGQFIQDYPRQKIAPLTPDQLALINQYVGLGENPFALNPSEQSAANAYGQLASGANYTVPYGEKIFQDITAPTVESQMALAGLGNSGALGENLAMAGEQMALRLAEQGIQAQETGAQGLFGVGSQQFNQGITNLANALQAAGIPQQEAQAILSSRYNQRLGQLMAGLGEENMVASWLPALIGQNSSGSSSQTGFSLF